MIFYNLFREKNLKTQKLTGVQRGMLKVALLEIGFQSLCKKGNHLGDRTQVLSIGYPPVYAEISILPHPDRKTKNLQISKSSPKELRENHPITLFQISDFLIRGAWKLCDKLYFYCFYHSAPFLKQEKLVQNLWIA